MLLVCVVSIMLFYCLYTLFFRTVSALRAESVRECSVCMLTECLLYLIRDVIHSILVSSSGAVVAASVLDTEWLC